MYLIKHVRVLLENFFGGLSMSRQLQLREPAVACRACNLTVPKENHLTIQTATQTIYVCAHHYEPWMEKVKAAAKTICDLAGQSCEKISGLSERIIKESKMDLLASLAERLLEAVYNKTADQLKKAVGEGLAAFRKALFALAHLLDYPRTAQAFII